MTLEERKAIVGKAARRAQFALEHLAREFANQGFGLSMGATGAKTFLLLDVLHTAISDVRLLADVMEGGK